MRLHKTKQLLMWFVLLSLLPVAYSQVVFNDALFNFMRNKYKNSAVERTRNWQQLITSNKNQSIEDQLFETNRFFNNVEFKSDLSHWGKKDYWATPLEFLGTNAGDCEDFTIAKYVTLLELGVPDAKLRLMYVTATRPTRQAHMVLAYYETPTSVPLVLDNINKRILPASQRRDLIPVYSFNGEGLWLAKAQGRGRQMQSGNNNKLWLDVLNRMKEGF